MNDKTEKKWNMLRGLTAVLFALAVFLGQIPGLGNDALAVWNETHFLEREYVERSWDGSKVVTNHCRNVLLFSTLEERWEKYAPAPNGGSDRFSLFSGSAYPGRQFVWYIADKSMTFPERCIVMGDVHLIINDGVTITCKDGIQLPANSTLHIHPSKEGTGKLICLADTNFCAAIGGDSGQGGGNLIIHGCEITADGNDWGTDAAGIGGGNAGSGGEVTIYGGKVYARGSQYGSGIGSGDADGEGIHGGKVTIYGGDVTAIGGYDSAGIGGGEGGSGAEVRIYGGTVTATGGKEGDSYDGGAGIGSGDKDGRNNNAGKCYIYGGTVNATGGANGAGIGGGDDGSGGIIEIHGGKVTAKSGRYGAGIGGGENGHGGTITITGGEVSASMGFMYGIGDWDYGAGIGGGYKGDGGTITISGGNVSAQGGEGAAGIGGSYYGSSGTITITGGKIGAWAKAHFNTDDSGAGIGSGCYSKVRRGIDRITISSSSAPVEIQASGANGGAGIGTGSHSVNGDGLDISISGPDTFLYQIKGGPGGAAIGGGYKGNGGNITIDNARVRANGFFSATGIGGGDYGNGGNITITGKNCNVEAHGGTVEAGIGGGEEADGGTIIIKDAGRVYVTTQGYTPAAIGGGGSYHERSGSGGNITISNSLVTAINTSGGRAIGRGSDGKSEGTLTINPPAAVLAGGNADSLELIENSVFMGNHNQTYVEIKPAYAWKVTYDRNGATRGNAPVDKNIYYSDASPTFRVWGPGNLSKTGRRFLGWNTQADGSGVDYSPTKHYPVSGNITLYARWSKDPVSNLEWDEQDFRLVERTGVIDYVDFTDQLNFLGNMGGAKWYVVNEDTRARDLVVEGEVHLIIKDGVNLEVTRGIVVEEPYKLIIHGQKNMTGRLITTGIAGTAGIGSRTGHRAGFVAVNGVQVVATGGANAAGIGGVSSSGGTLEMNGGFLQAYGNGNAGISSDSVTVNGGMVLAYGSDGGAGIGGGQGRSGGTVTINAGTVMATGRDGGAGIGGGRYGEGGTVTIKAGTVTAEGSNGGAGIGGGNTRKGGTVTIDGGLVTAKGANGGAGIGGGSGAEGGTVTVSGGMVRATGGSAGSSKGAGIGSGASNTEHSLLYVAQTHAVYSSTAEITDPSSLPNDQQEQGHGIKTDIPTSALLKLQYMLVQDGTEKQSNGIMNGVNIFELEDEYICLEDAGGIWQKGSGVKLSFHFKSSNDDAHAFYKCTGIEVDGKPVDSENYDKARGSVWIHLKPTYLETLSVGSHQLNALFMDGKGEATFEIINAEVLPDSLPNTGDSQHPLLYLVLALAGLAAVCLLRRKV